MNFMFESKVRNSHVFIICFIQIQPKWIKEYIHKCSWNWCLGEAEVYFECLIHLLYRYFCTLLFIRKDSMFYIYFEDSLVNIPLFHFTCALTFVLAYQLLLSKLLFSLRINLLKLLLTECCSSKFRNMIILNVTIWEIRF